MASILYPQSIPFRWLLFELITALLEITISLMIAVLPQFLFYYMIRRKGEASLDHNTDCKNNLASRACICHPFL